MNIKDKSIGSSIGVLDVEQGGTALGGECCGRSPVVAGDEDHLCRGAAVADPIHHGLDGLCPFVDVGDVMRLK